MPWSLSGVRQRACGRQWHYCCSAPGYPQPSIVPLWPQPPAAVPSQIPSAGAVPGIDQCLTPRVLQGAVRHLQPNRSLTPPAEHLTLAAWLFWQTPNTAAAPCTELTHSPCSHRSVGGGRQEARDGAIRAAGASATRAAGVGSSATTTRLSPSDPQRME